MPMESRESEQDGAHDDLSWMDKCFFQKCFATVEYGTQLSVVDFTIDTACSSVESCIRGIQRASLTLDNGNNNKKTITLIIKYLPQNCEKAVLPGLIENFKKETLMYSRIMNEVECILASVGCSEQLSARYYTSGVEPSQYIVTEDLAMSGYEMARRKGGLDLQHGLLVMRTLAKLHAASAVLLSNDSQLINEIGPCCRYTEETGKQMRPQLVTGGALIANNVAKFTDIPPDLHNRIVNFSITVADKLQALAIQRPGKFNVLVHGDLWVNNTMFKYVCDQPSSVRFIDFQESYISSPAIDLLYFIYTSTNTDIEAECFIEEYYKYLEDILVSLRFTGPRYTFQDLKDDLEEYKVFSVFASLFVTAGVFIDIDDGFNLVELVYKNNADQIEKFTSNPSYLEVVKRRMPFILEQNVL